jgi:hypothetical protein
MAHPFLAKTGGLKTLFLNGLAERVYDSEKNSSESKGSRGSTKAAC